MKIVGETALLAQGNNVMSHERGCNDFSSSLTASMILSLFLSLPFVSLYIVHWFITICLSIRQSHWIFQRDRGLVEGEKRAVSASLFCKVLSCVIEQSKQTYAQWIGGRRESERETKSQEGKKECPCACYASSSFNQFTLCFRILSHTKERHLPMNKFCLVKLTPPHGVRVRVLQLTFSWLHLVSNVEAAYHTRRVFWVWVSIGQEITVRRGRGRESARNDTLFYSGCCLSPFVLHLLHWTFDLFFFATCFTRETFIPFASLFLSLSLERHLAIPDAWHSVQWITRMIDLTPLSIIEWPRFT